MLFVPSPYYYSTSNGIQTLVPLTHSQRIHVMLCTYCRKIATSGFEDTAFLLLGGDRSFAPVSLWIICRFVFKLANRCPSLDEESSLLDLCAFLARIVRYLVGHHRSLCTKFLGIGRVHSRVFGCFNRRVEGKHHFLGLFYVVSVLLVRFMHGDMFVNVTWPTFLIMSQFFLVLLELQLKAKVGAHVRPNLPHKPERIQEMRVVRLHIVSYDKGCRLHNIKLTLEMPAPQCTKTAPRLRSD